MIREPIYDIMIAGGGASGLMAALTAGRADCSVLLVEQKDCFGKKITATGNGRCNFTNAKMDPSCYHGDIRFFDHIYPSLTNEDTIRLFHDLGIFPKNKNGYYYPANEQASSVVSALLGALSSLPVTLCPQEKVLDITKEKDCFLLKTDRGFHRGRKLLIACGLKAAPKLGSDGSLLPVLQKLGHEFQPVAPALCGFYAKGIKFSKVAGVRTEAIVSLLIDDVPVCSDHGELQLTDYGISGIPVFQISSPASLALRSGKACRVIIDFLPYLEEEEIGQEVKLRRRLYGEQPAMLLLNGLLPSKLAEVLLAEAGINGKDSCLAINDRKLDKLSHICKQLSLTLTKVRDYEFAQVCTGGIGAEEVNMETLESKVIKGLFFAGEILNIDGICGGYNLQWAWSSGYAAGAAMSKRD